MGNQAKVVDVGVEALPNTLKNAKALLTTTPL
jgi:hypothetical protein